MKFFTPFIIAGALLFAAPVMAQETAGSGGNTNMEILLQKVKADKKLLVAGNMDLSDAEGKNFWPIYDNYQKELDQINQRLGKTIMEYADAFNKGPIPNDTAKKLLNDVLTIEEAEIKLKRTYADKVGKVLSPAKTARYIQIENKIRALLKMELAANIPLVY
ncbi:MAG TPA: hypothetical protein VLA67_11865 [Nitrospiraceae bacterium]|nr:hypothetical protein [Nitrospiraceae bacterium]